MFFIFEFECDALKTSH